MIVFENRSSYNVSILGDVLRPKKSRIFPEDFFISLIIYSIWGACIIDNKDGKYTIKNMGKIHVKLDENDKEKFIIY